MVATAFIAQMLKLAFSVSATAMIPKNDNTCLVMTNLDHDCHLKICLELVPFNALLDCFKVVGMLLMLASDQPCFFFKLECHATSSCIFSTSIFFDYAADFFPQKERALFEI